MKEKLRPSQINESEGNSLPRDLPYKKCYRESFKLKRKDATQKLKTI